MDEETLEIALSTETDFAHLQKFLDEGYQGLYQLTEDQIRTRKQLPYNAFILDWMNSQELEINLRRIDQTHQHIRDERVRGWENLKRIHFEVGRALRRAIQEAGGTLPEDQPTPEKSIQQLQGEMQQPFKKREHFSITSELAKEFLLSFCIREGKETRADDRKNKRYILARMLFSQNFSEKKGGKEKKFLPSFPIALLAPVRYNTFRLQSSRA